MSSLYVTRLIVSLLLLTLAVSAAPRDAYASRRAPKPAQYQSQDATSGSYKYGYTSPHHSKSESSVNGVTRGGYSYIDANGQLQTVSYTADAENGFRVQASNLPSRNSLVPVQDTPEVAMAKKRHLDQVRKVESLPSTWQQQQQQQPQKERSQRYPSQRSKSRHLFLLDPEEIHGIAVPRPSNAIVEPPRGFAVSTSSHHVLLPTTRVIVPMMPVIQTSMRHTQDSLGQYEYSYTGDTSAKTESRSLDGTTRGAYSYIDANGLLQQVHYIADEHGFRAAGTNFPEGLHRKKRGLLATNLPGA